ncbi:MAG: OsmC family protein [Candidatus Omnitrophota bacterium]|nr:OsmC family protein [Candidatus Omnitrophota bacterium]
MEQIEILYSQDLRCKIKNSNAEYITIDAPEGFSGSSQAMSPTDLLVSSLGCCMFMLMALVVKKHGINLLNCRLIASKQVYEPPNRRIAKIALDFYIPQEISHEKKKLLEESIYNCPVQQSLHPDIKYEANFHYEKTILKHCKKCRIPLTGLWYNWFISKVFGVRPSQNDPELCNKCAEEG